MVPLETLPFAIVFLAFAGIVKGATGFGLPLLAVPALANILGPKQAVIIMSIPSFLVGAWMMTQSRAWTMIGKMGPLVWLVVTLLAGTVIGAKILASVDTTYIGVAVGITAITFTLVALRGKPLDLRDHADRLAPVFGAIGGVLNGATNTYGPLIAMYLRAIQLDKLTFVATINLLFTVSGLVQISSFWALGLYSTESLLMSFAACVPIAAGVLLGMRANFLMGQKVFDRVVLAVIFVSGMRLIIGTFWH
jgi:uncharacterized membrane protein YfcA